LSLSPEKLHNVINMKEEEIMFESLRGSVHICIMGEGYASLPNLYGHKMTNGLAEFIREDDLRNKKCALFFLSRGFPFVSIMEGGFAAAHACLCREGSEMGLKVNDVLTDYNPEISLFGQFEKLHNLSGRDKAQRSLQNMFDSSMTALTKNSMRFETDFTGGNIDEQTQHKGGQKSVVQRFFGGKTEKIVDDKQPSGRNPFTRKLQTIRNGRSNFPKEESSRSIVVESAEFDDKDSLSSTMVHNSPGDQTFPVKEDKNEKKKSLEVTNGPQKSEIQQRSFSGLNFHHSNPQMANESHDATSAPAQTKGPAGRSPFLRFGKPWNWSQYETK